jgi:hypothetical protein
MIISSSRRGSSGASNQSFLLTAIALLILAAPAAGLADTVTFGLGADDYGSLTINGTQVALYDDEFAAGGANGTFNMNPGQLYNVTIIYENRIGTGGMDLSWNQAGSPAQNYGSVANTLAPNDVPLADLSNSGASGLVGTFSDLSGNNASVISGLGPIDYGVGPWPAYGYYDQFKAVFTGQIELPAAAAPLPSTAYAALALLSALAVRRLSHRRVSPA